MQLGPMLFWANYSEICILLSLPENAAVEPAGLWGAVTQTSKLLGGI